MGIVGIHPGVFVRMANTGVGDTETEECENEGVRSGN